MKTARNVSVYEGHNSNEALHFKIINPKLNLSKSYNEYCIQSNNMPKCLFSKVLYV